MKILAFMFTLTLCANALFSQVSSEASTVDLIIKFKADDAPNSERVLTQQLFDHSELNALNQVNGIQSITLTGNKKMGNTYVLSLNSNTPPESLIKTYELTDLFEYVELNARGAGHGLQTIPDDFNFNRQWSHFNDGSFTLASSTDDADIDTDLAWDITQGDPDLIVAILDSGAKMDHPEFSGRIWSNADESENSSDSDSNGYLDDVNGWDFANGDNDPTDDHGHGTNVAGIAVASGNNSIGYAGMNWNSQIMICKILEEDNTGFYSWWAEAIYYAVDNGAAVINLSAGGSASSNLLEEAINYAHDYNVPVVVSTGNQNSEIQYPAKYENALAIGSTNPDDTRSLPFFWDITSGSNFGPEIDFVAPGNYTYGLHYLSNTNYNTYWGGTSQAAPHVTGLISLLLSEDPSLTIDEIRLILEDSSEDLIGTSEDTPGWDEYYGHGRINAFQALMSPVLNVDNAPENDRDLLVFPNPAITPNPLEISSLKDGDYSISIYNSLGQCFFKHPFTTANSAITISLPEMSTGTYLLRIFSESEGKSTGRKLFVN